MPETVVSVGIVKVVFGIPKSTNVIPAGVVIVPNDTMMAWLVVVAFAQFEAAPK